LHSGKTAWLSRGFEELLRELEKPQLRGYVFDVIVVGSGYGGAIAAAELAGCTDADGRRVSVCVLERGREYLSGMFPSRFAEVPLHVRFSTERTPAPRGRREGLFDIRLGADVSAILANGLGGGSLINAGVMERPDPAALRGWPPGVAEALFGKYYAQAEAALGAARTIGDHPRGEPAKLRAFRGLARGRVRRAAISVGVTDEHNDAGVHLGECKRCGDCATGCNHGSKNSLDVNLLARARAGRVRIFTGATVLSVGRDGDGTWLVRAMHTDEALRKRQGEPAELRARKVILAAGTFGSTELLLRLREQGATLSHCVGRRFSANGDAIGAIYNHAQRANAVADESVLADDRHVGPTITGMLDLRRRWLARGCVIQEIAIPGPLRRVFEETITTSKVLHELGDKDRAAHHPDEPAQDPCAVDAAALRRTSVFVMMGDDGARGELRLVRDGAQAGDGALRVHWPELKEDPLFDAQVKALETLARQGGPQARVLPNPLWQLLPSSMHFLIGNERGPALTVHPLGGCPMGVTAADGAVDHLGRVFDAADPRGERVLPGLVVLDGSIVRNALSINPALTIAALALRAVEGLRREWGYSEPRRDAPPKRARPVFRAAPLPQPARPTEIEIVERMNGVAALRSRDGGELECVIELTLRFEKRAIGELFLPRDGVPVPLSRTLRVRAGELRVFRKDRWDEWRRNGEAEENLAAIAEARAPVAGVMRLLHREPSTYRERRCRALAAWVLNRGLRDTWQAFVRGGERRGDWFRALWTLPQRVSGALALASRAGEVRRLDYRLALSGDAQTSPDATLDTSGYRAGAWIGGAKRLTYARRSNPWRQLMRLKLSDFPGLARGKPSLRLDEKFLAAEGVPLVKIVGQNDQVTALADVAAFVAYFLRLLLNIHVWSFRRPDAPEARVLQRLPGDIPGRLPKCDADEYAVEAAEPDVRIRLARYRPKAVRGVPLLMIHGYSASGTTFAHPAVKPNMAEYFCARGREVWIVDMRTSSGMTTATRDWRFEQAALVDIPAAVEIVCDRSGAQQVDIFAHCMGSAMFSMAVLSQPATNPGAVRPEAHNRLAGRIRRAVLSQVAPVLVMSPANIFRGYAMGYLRHFLPFKDYQFRVDPNAELVDQLIDRLLATLPYPEEEFDIENPPWPPWRRTPFAGTRHRMDALYGRDFSLADARGEALLGEASLDYIDDLFGPLSIETVSQAIHFARAELITNRRGRNEYVLPRHIRQRWKFPTLSIHGEENGLADVATLERFRTAFREQAGVEIQTRPFPGFGHQDSLIGTRAEQVFAAVHDFFEEREDAVAAV
jgi:choline dehydrogenase-like flavoprotein